METEKELFEGFGEDEDIELDPSDFSEDEETEEKEKEEESTTEKVDDEEEAKKKNSYYAELRRAKEREEREKKIKEDTKLETELGILKKNTYTGQPITDEEDLKIYKLQKEIEESGGDPINDLPKKIAELNRVASAKVKQEQEAKEQEQSKLEADIKEFVSKHPEVNTSELAKDNEYLSYAANKIGRWTTTEIYESYVASKNKTTKEVEEASAKVKGAIDEVAKQITKVPSSNTTNTKSSTSYLEMSDEEYIQQERKNTGDFF